MIIVKSNEQRSWEIAPIFDPGLTKLSLFMIWDRRSDMCLPSGQWGRGQSGWSGERFAAVQRRAESHS